MSELTLKQQGMGHKRAENQLQLPKGYDDNSRVRRIDEARSIKYSGKEQSGQDRFELFLLGNPAAIIKSC
jgi:hypothetical protein